MMNNENGSTMLVKRRRNLEINLDEKINKFDQLFKGTKETKEFKDSFQTNDTIDFTSMPTINRTTSLNSSLSSMNTNETITDVTNVTINLSSESILMTTSSPSTVQQNSKNNQPTTLPSYLVSDQIQLFDLPYSSHISIKQKDLNKIILIKQQELMETFRNQENSLYNHLVKESERQFEDQLNDLDNSNKQQMDNNDEHNQLVSICLKCHYTCKKCTGRKPTQCTICYSDSQLDSSGRCLLKDVANTINQFKSPNFWPFLGQHVQNWITIVSLILCIFFSLAFFYLLLCQKDKTHQSQHPNHQETNAKQFISPTSNEFANNEYYQTKQLPLIEPTNNREIHNLEQANKSSNDKSFIRSILRLFSLKRSSSNKSFNCTTTNGLKLMNQTSDHNKYNNLPIKFEVKTSNGICELNETNEEIT